MRPKPWLRVLLSVCITLPLAAIAGWYAHRFFGPEPATPLSPAANPAEARVLAVIEEMERTKAIRFGIPAADGRRLRLLAESIGARHVVEIGTSTGYSGLWLGLGVLPTQGRVTTFELDPAVAERARAHFSKAGLDQTIQVIVGDAHQQISRVQGPIDMVFIDADKEGYVDYLDKVLLLVRPGGLILAHNVSAAPDYMRRVTTDPRLDTIRLTHASGLSASLKKR